MNKKPSKKLIRFLICAFLYLCFSIIFRQNTVNAINRDNSHRLDQTFWNQNPTDDDIIDALFGEGSIYTKERIICTNPGTNVNGHRVCNEWSPYNGECKIPYMVSCLSSNPNDCIYHPDNSGNCAISPNSCTGMRVVHITGSNLSAYYPILYGLQQGYIGSPYTIYVLETGYTILTQHEKFYTFNCSAIISNITGGSTILDNNQYSDDDDDAFISVAGHHWIIDNINMDGKYKTPTTMKTSATRYGILSNGIHGVYPMDRNITINNIFISNINTRGINFVGGDIRNLVINNATFHNTHSDVAGGCSIYLGGVYDSQLNNIKIFDDLYGNYDSKEKIEIVGSSGIALNNIYIAPNTGDKDIYLDSSNNIVINNLIGSVFTLNNTSQNCYINNIIGTVYGTNNRCYLYGYQKIFNGNTGASVRSGNSLKIDDSTNQLTRSIGTKTDIGCLTWNYIINPFTGTVNNYYKYNWFSGGITDTSGCIFQLGNGNINPIYSNSGLLYSYGIDIPGQSQTVKFEGDTIVRWNLPANSQNNNYYIASSTTRRPNLSIVGNDDPLVSGYAKVKVLNGTTSLPNATVFGPYISGTYKTLGAASPYWTNPVPIIFKNPDTVGDRVLIGQVGFTDGFTHFTKVSSYTTGYTTPTITITQPYTGDWKQSKTVTGSATNASGFKMVIKSDSGCDNTTSGFGPYSDKTFNLESNNGYFICYRASNQYGTAYKISQKIEKIDTTKPNCQWGDPTPETILPGQTGKITLTCRDLGAGISTTSLNENDFILSLGNIVEIDKISVSGSTGTRTFEVEYVGVSNGQTTIQIKSNKISDNAENKNIAVTSVVPIVIGDITPPLAPVCTPTSACFSGNSQTINCYTATQGATVRYTAYTNNGNLPNCNSTQRTNTSFSNTTTLNVIACSQFGIASSINTYHYTKDTTGPIAPTHISPNNNATTNKIRPTLKWNPTTDVGCSSVSSYEVRVCNHHGCGTPSNIIDTGVTGSTSRDVPQNLQDEHSYYRQVRAKDNLGNRGERSEQTKFTIEAVKPTCSRGTPTQQCISGGVAGTINLICTDAAGITTNSLSNNAIEYSGNLITLSNATVSEYSERYQAEEGTTNPSITAIFENDKDITTTLVSQSNAKMIAGLVPITLNGKKYTFTYTGKAGVNGSTTFTLKANKVKNPSDVYAPSVTSAIGITIDNSAPAVPTMTQEPQYTQGLSNTVSSNTVSDNGCNPSVQYQFCKSETQSLGSKNCPDSSNWVTQPQATFSNLTDGKIYYYFVRAKDGLGNTSNWSDYTSSTQDNTRPIITFDKNSGPAAQTHTVKVTITDTGSHLINNEKLYYRWQTSNTCSNIETNYTMTTSFTYSNGGVTARINVTTPESLPNGEYYLCILGNYIQDTVGNKNITTRTAGKFIKADVPPTVSATNSSTNWKSGDIQITLNVQSVTSLSYAKYSRESLAKCKNNGTSFTNGQQIQKTSEGTQTLYLCAQDTYGQTGEWSGTYKLDKTKPTGSFSGISQYCIPKNTYAKVSITGNDSVSGFPNRPIKWNNETNRYEFTSIRNIVAGDIVTATIKDNAGNITGLSAKVEKCPDEENFVFSFSESNCTSGNITVTISGDYTHVIKYQRGDGTAWITNNYRQFSENRSGQIKIELDNGTILSGPRLYLNVTNIDKEAPTVTIIDAPESVNECETGTIIFSVQDSLCGSGSITANITGNGTILNDEVRNGSGEVIFTTRFADAVPAHGKVNYVFTDSVGNKTNGQEELKLNDVPLTGRDFKRELIKVGNKYVASGNWKDLSRAKAGLCETITATKKSCDSNLTINNNLFIYTGSNNTTTTCKFQLSDGGDSSITIKGTFKFCNSSNDCTPTLYPKFISGTYYTEYSDKERGYNKYTSGTESSALVLIDIDGDGYSNMSGYRYSYIQGKNYCKELTDWKPCSTAFRGGAIPGFCEFLSGFLEANGTTNPKTCIAEEPSRTNWLPYPNDNIFQINIADSDKWSDTIPYQSAYQGPRQIWIQVQDSSGTGRTSAQVATDIINYTTERPYIELAEDNNRKWGGKTIYTVNDNEFTIVLSANGANLENGLSGLNYNYYNSLTNDYPILIQSGVLKLDIFNQWLLSKYRGR